MNFGSVFKKVATVLSLIFGFILLAELGFRISQASRSEVAAIEETGHPPKDMTPAELVCIGNSPTAGAGAPPDKSYCRQLQAVAETKGQKLLVQNWGVPTFNTADMLKDINSRLPLVKPKTALVMAGASNAFNFKGYVEFLERQGAVKTASPDGWLESFLTNHSALYARYRNFADSNSNLYPFKVNDTKNANEVAYRWLSWARSKFPIQRLTEAQTISAAEAMKHIKKIDPNNVAADLFLAELEAVSFGDQEKALQTFKAIPKEYEVCIAFLEVPALKKASEDFLPELKDFLNSTAKKWDEKFTGEELNFIQTTLGKFNATGSAERLLGQNLVNKSRQIQALFETLSDCGTPSDVTQLFLIEDRLRNGDFAGLFARVERQLQTFPLTPNIDLIQWLTLVRGLGLNSSELNQRYESSKAAFEQKFGEGLTSTVFVTPESVDKWTVAELTEIVEDLKKQNVQVVLMGYPPFPFRGVHPIKKTPIEDLPQQDVDAKIRQVADSTQTRFFDTYAVLKKQFKDVKDLKKFYSLQVGPLDDHLNAAGYEVLANEIYEYLKSEKLL